MQAQLNNTLLYLDGSSPQTRVGIWRDGHWLAYCQRESTVLNSLFQLIESCLDSTSLDLSQIDGYCHNQGPGSQLGIRLCAMAIRTWQALPIGENKVVYNFRSTDLAHAIIQQNTPAPSPYWLIVDFRQNQWIASSSENNSIELMDNDKVASIKQECYHLVQRKAWVAPPKHSHKINLDMQKYPKLLTQDKLFKKNLKTQILTISPSEFKKWTPQRHGNHVNR